MRQASIPEELAAMVERGDIFDRHGPEEPPSPVIISVPHAGRDYPAAIMQRARIPVTAIRRLEDRFADCLVAPLVERGYDVLIARVPRAVIDLNRREREIDPLVVRGVPHNYPLMTSAKVQGGLGLFPRRLQGVGELWRHPMEWAEAAWRIEHIHRPYHAALAAMMQRARAAFGHAILLDVHSMPTLPEPAGDRKLPRIVLGDRFGQSASARLMALAESLFSGAGHSTAQNHPYPGNYLIERHGKPVEGFHALQVEIDRSLYLDAALEQPGSGLAAMQRVLVDLVRALESALPDAGQVQAAE